MSSKFLLRSFALITCLSSNSYVFSQQIDSKKTGNVFELSASAEYGTIDNFFYQSSQEQSTSYWQLKPQLMMQLQSEQQQLAFNIDTVHTQYDKFDEDNHSDITLDSTYLFKLAENKTFFLSGHWQDTFEQRGTGLSIGQGQSLGEGDVWQLAHLAGGYRYGSVDSVAKLQVELGVKNKRYDTRRHATRLLDQQTSYGSLSFDYLLATGSYVATDISYQQLEFDHNPQQDKAKSSALLGMKWVQSQQNQLAILLGYQQISFDQSIFENDEGFKWRFTWFWSPTQFTHISVSSERDFDEANRLADSYRLADNHRVTLNYKFSEFFTANADIGLKQEDIIYRSHTATEDHFYSKVKINYLPTDWLTIYFHYHFKDLDASDVMLEHQRNSISLGINVNI